MVAARCALVVSATLYQNQTSTSQAAQSRPVFATPLPAERPPDQHNQQKIAAYRAAQEAIKQQAWQNAAEQLALLVNDARHSRLRYLCAIRLAECHVKLGAHDRALDVLNSNLPKLRELLGAQAQTNIDFRAACVVHRELCQQLPESLSALEQLKVTVGPNPLQSWPVTAADLLHEQWRRQRNLKLITDARQTANVLLSEPLGSMLSQTQRDALEKFKTLGVAIAQLEDLVTKAELDQAQQLLDQQVDLLKASQGGQELRFAFAELLLRHHHFEQALVELDKLTALLTSDEKPTSQWHEVIALRSVETLVRLKRHAQAIRHIDKVIARPQTSVALRNKLQFLAARCYVANVEFESAIARLRDIQSSKNADSAGAKAQAYWFEGEVHLLARDTKQALLAYGEAAKTESNYQSLAKLQLAQCLEQLGRYQQAYETYLELSNSEDSEVRLLADQRATRVAEMPEVNRR